MYSGTSNGARLAAIGILVVAIAGAGWAVDAAADADAGIEATPTPASEDAEIPTGKVADEAVSELGTDPPELPSVSVDEMGHPLTWRDAFVDDVWKNDRLITFLTLEAEHRVRTFEIDCPQPGKTISLMDLLRVAVSQGARETTELRVEVDSRGEDVRVYHQIFRDGEPLMKRKVVMQLDRWNELRLFGIHPEAVMNQCFLLS